MIQTWLASVSISNSSLCHDGKKLQSGNSPTYRSRTSRAHLRHGGKKSSGLTLIELLVSLTISVFLILGAAKLFIHSRVAFRAQEFAGQLTENGRIASEILNRTIRLARNWGCAGSDDAAVTNHLDLDAMMRNPDSSFQNPTDPDFSQSEQQGIYGIRNSPENGTDEITVFHISNKPSYLVENIESDADTTNNPDPLDSTAVISIDDASNLNPGDFVVINDCSKADIFRLSNVDKANNQLRLKTCLSCTQRYQKRAILHALNRFRFYIARGANNEPALFLQESGNRSVELIEGIERMRIYYGEDINHDGVVDRYVLPDVIDDTCEQDRNQDCWRRVASVRISMLLRSTVDNITQDIQTYIFDGIEEDAPDRRLRRAFTTVITLRNHRI